MSVTFCHKTSLSNGDIRWARVGKMGNLSYGIPLRLRLRLKHPISD